MYKLSVIIITRNEEANIRACLESVAWADEIIVVDAGSSDATAEICRESGAKIFVHDWPGFGPQKNRALSYASHDWVFSIDADERATPELRAAIEAVLRNDAETCAAYRISRLSSYCGRFMRHSGWRSDFIVRLFKRDAAHFSDDLVHERLLVDGKIGQLDGELLHYAFEDFEEVLSKINSYSTAGAEMLHRRGRRASLSGAVLRGLWSFIRTYFLRAGFLDGREGFMLAVSNAEGTYYRYLKLMMLNRKT
ncbi:MAG: glycosyl transferase family 2 [Betaproteobacteria bacterium RBG_16_56_24]|nr:MAG: glycosyl transferase family 2 [Betaproteobacteria bacterium RBG_16_56_24]